MKRIGNGLSKPCAELGCLEIEPAIQRRLCETNLQGSEKTLLSGTQVHFAVLFLTFRPLYTAGKVSLEEALKNADSPNNLKLKIQNVQNGEKDPETSTQKFELIDEEKEDDPELQQKVAELKSRLQVHSENVQ